MKNLIVGNGYYYNVLWTQWKVNISYTYRIQWFKLENFYLKDIIYCPKCNIPIIVDENDTHSFCLNCNLDYCRICKSNWHHGKCLTEAMNIEKKLKNLKITMADLISMTDEQIRERFGNNLNVILRVKKEAVDVDEKQKNTDYLQKFVRCPKCRSPIDKFEG